jgi:hypothetical protein
MPATLDLELYAGDRVEQVLTHCVPGSARIIGDGNVVLVDGDATITAPDAGFVAGDVGKVIAGGGIPPGTTISSVTSGTVAEMSAVATDSTEAGTVFVGDAVNLTGRTFAAQIRDHASAADTQVTFTIDQTTYLTTGQLVLTLTGAQTQGLRTGVWDLECSSDDQTYWAGDVIVTQDVTR